jgi:hypothetical protein
MAEAIPPPLQLRRSGMGVAAIYVYINYQLWDFALFFFFFFFSFFFFTIEYILNNLSLT